MTAGQQIFEQGREKGIEQGRQLGRQEGVQGMLLRLLRQRFGDAVNADVEQRIATASVEQIEAWSARVLSAATLAELFAD
jgi:predicted transposase YdaD